MPVSISYFSVAEALEGADALCLVGRADQLRSDAARALLPDDVAANWDAMLDSVSPGDKGGATRTWSAGSLRQVVAAVLPTAASRNNSPGRPDAIPGLVGSAFGGGVRCGAVVLVCDEDAHAYAAGIAVSRAFPHYSGKSKSKGSEEKGLADLRVAVLGDSADLPRMSATEEGIRLAGRLVDTPPCTLNTTAFVSEAEALASELGCGIEVISGADIPERGFGGHWGVGKASEHPPALVILKHEPEAATDTIAWVGKGIVYDTGGLSIKGKNGMPGMKADMGGAAAVIGAFSAAVKLGAPQTIYALLCLAENSVGPAATRPDDILTLYSGKTVEVNNTDAEGRLVLGDGVAYATKHLAPSTLVDLATLTGAQLMATGRKHAGVVCNDDSLEARAVAAGKSCGDLVHPLPFVPEFYRGEFASKIADMKNSVKDRMNAQSSCAGQFVYNHVDADWEGAWLHVDLAGPATTMDGRGTGYGVALLLELFGIGG